MVLKGGFTSSDRRLGRVPEWDPRNAKYAVRSLIRTALLTRTWGLGYRYNQTSTPQCVPHTGAELLMSDPVRAKFPGWANAEKNPFIANWYGECQDNDQWPGRAYEGTSGQALAKTGRDRGYWENYAWCLSVDDIASAIASVGPVAIGIPWPEEWFKPRPSGLLEPSGGPRSYAGGHELLVRGVVTQPRLKGESRLGPCFRLTNHWGRDWGVGGDALVRIEDFEAVFKDEGDAFVPVGQKNPFARKGVIEWLKGLRF